jgi:hypothetical protein
MFNMKTNDLFSINRKPKKLNESLFRIFGKKINLENFDLLQLQDARNKLRTQLSQMRGTSGFNENLENDAYHQAQFMMDAINAEIAERDQHFVEADVEEGQSDVDYELHLIAKSDDEEELIDAMEGLKGAELQIALEDMMSELKDELASKGMNDVINDQDKMIELLMDKIIEEYGEGGEEYDDGGETDDNYALSSAGFGSDEDYGDFGREESIQGETMNKITEGEVQQASAIVAAKTMVDRVGRWIEELSGMENDSLLQLGDQIRDEMGQEQAKNFISTVAPAISQALANLKETREVLSTGVRVLTGEEKSAQMLGADAEGEEEAPAEPDAMNAAPAAPAVEPAGDEFAAAEPAAGGAEAAGREQRESVEFQNRLLRVLAG